MIQLLNERNGLVESFAGFQHSRRPDILPGLAFRLAVIQAQNLMLPKRVPLGAGILPAKQRLIVRQKLMQPLTRIGKARS